LQAIKLVVSTDSSAKADAIQSTLTESGLEQLSLETKVVVCPNRGRNLGPLFLNLWPQFKDGSLLLHLHGKRSRETTLGADWLEQLLTSLLPDAETIRAIRWTFAQDSRLGLLMPQAPDLIRPYLNWGNNYEFANQLALKIQGPLARDAVLVFPAGGMFWVRPQALAPLAACCNSLPDLPPEPLPVDGTSLHAMERLVAHACEASGQTWKMLCPEPAQPSSEPANALSVWEARPEDFQQATALLAARCRQQEEELACTAQNLDHCSKQLETLMESSNTQLKQADEQLRDLMEQVAERDQRLAQMSSSLSWKLTRPLRWLKRRAQAGT
jgi:lipopolysaccharide biosynthesis protein